MKSRLKRVKVLKAHRDNQQTGPSAELLALLAGLKGMSKEELVRLLGVY
jgi:hypothetical protein